MAGRVRRHALDAIDRAIVAALEKDGRMPNVEIAKLVGVSEKTVRARIVRLVDEHGLVITAELTDATRRSRMIYLVHTEPGQRFAVARSLAQHPEVDRVDIVTGYADLLVTASFPDDATALRFQVHTVENCPGVRNADSCHVIADAGPRSGDTGHVPAVDRETLAGMMIDAAPTDPGRLTDAICDAATLGLGADRVLIATRHSGSARRVSATAKRRGISQSYLDAIIPRIEEGRLDGVIMRVWQTRLHVLIPDARTDPLMAAAHDLVRREGFVTMLTLPVLYGDSLVATISLYYDRPMTIDNSYLAVAQGVADHYAVALARAMGPAPSTPDRADRS